MSARLPWTRQQLLVAFYLYTTELTFGQCHARQPLVIEYARLINRTPSALAMKLCNIASLDPAITHTGRKGLSGASAADRAMWQTMQSDWTGFFAAAEAAIEELDVGRAVAEPVEVCDQSVGDYYGGARRTEIEVRVGQGSFRRAVLSAYAHRCCISGLAEPRLLVASHIVPWRADENNRLNPRNGLALSMLHDKAFDIGLITVDDQLRVVVSDQRWSADDEFLQQSLVRYHGQSLHLPEKFMPQQAFLEYHREHVFLG